MLSSITPVGERARGQRWWITATAYVLGSVLGGAAVGGGLGAVGWLVLGGLGDGVALALLAAVAVIGLAADAAGRVPTRHRQVNERWLGTYRGWVYGGGFGFQLGLGVATVVPASVTYVALSAALLSRAPVAGLVVGATFGAVRSLPLLATGRVRRPEGLRGFHRRLAGLGEAAHRGVQAAQLAVAVAALGVVVAA